MSNHTKYRTRSEGGKHYAEIRVDGKVTASVEMKTPADARAMRDLASSRWATSFKGLELPGSAEAPTTAPKPAPAKKAPAKKAKPTRKPKAAAKTAPAKKK